MAELERLFFLLSCLFSDSYSNVSVENRLRLTYTKTCREQDRKKLQKQMTKNILNALLYVQHHRRFQHPSYYYYTEVLHTMTVQSHC